MEIGWIDTPQDWRGFFLMCFPLAGTLLFLISIIFTVIIGSLTVSTLNKTRKILDQNVRPTLDNVREATENMKGTVSFVSDRAVRPVMRVYGFYAGARKFASVMGRF